MNTTVTFSVLLMQIFRETGCTIRKAHDIIKNAGSALSYQTLSAYRNFTSVPSAENARKILDAFGYPISDEELLACLDYSREQLKEIRETRDKYINKGLRLKVEQFGEDLTPAMLEQIINERIFEKTGKDGNFSKYVEQLIKEDIQNSTKEKKWIQK